jgi:anti-sigma regulatory factor (Ser/Thr protein kinase)
MSVVSGGFHGAGTREVSTSSVVLLPYRPASVAAARWRLAEELRQAGVADPAVGDVSLVLTELLSNAILHASPLGGTTLRVTWALAEGWVEVAVSDGGGETEPEAKHPPPSATGGRGLAIVEHLSHCWGVHTSDTGTTVWAVMAAPGEDAAGEGAPGEGAQPGAMLAEGPAQDASAPAGGVPADTLTTESEHNDDTPARTRIAGRTNDRPAPAYEG